MRKPTITRVLLTVAAVVSLTSCGGGDDGDSPAAQSSTGGELRNADEVRADEQSAAAAKATVGTPVTVEDLTGESKSDVTVSALKIGGDDAGPWLEITVVVANPSDKVSTIPRLGIVCTGSPEVGGNQAGGTLHNEGTEIPAKSKDEGKLRLLLPGDSRTGEVVPECPTPAVIRIYYGLISQGTKFGKTAELTIPDAMITKLNAKRAAA
jgi:hypothetical protein